PATKKTPDCAGVFEERSGLFVEFQHMIPVDQTVDERLQIFRTGVAIVDVIGMLPDIDAEDRLAAMDERVLAVRRLGNLQLAVLHRKPGPAGAELRRAGGDEVGAELVVAAEVAVDRLLQL